MVYDTRWWCFSHCCCKHAVKNVTTVRKDKLVQMFYNPYFSLFESFDLLTIKYYL